MDCDFRTPSVIGAREIDHAFTDLVAADDGSVAVQVLDRAHGTGVELSFGPWAPWLQIHTADRPEPENNRVGLAVEPMNCPPNAFNAPEGPPILESGATHVAQWTISALPPPTGDVGLTVRAHTAGGPVDPRTCRLGRTSCSVASARGAVIRRSSASPALRPTSGLALSTLVNHTCRICASEVLS